MDARNNVLLSLLFVAVFVMGFVVLFGERGLFHVIQSNAELADLKAENQRLAQQEKDLARAASRLRSDSSYVEGLARTQYGLVGAEDLVFCFDSKKGGKGEAAVPSP